MPIFARRYDMQSVLGQGGHGVVWQAHDMNLARDVAIKFFRPGLSPGLIFREAQVHVTLAGPRVLEVLDAAIYNDIPFIVTRVAAAGSVMDKITGGSGERADTAIRWTRHLLSGLVACHQLDLLHRDVKPGNLFLMNQDTGLLGDFGLLERMINGAAPKDGTEAFLAPEVLRKGQMNVQSDIYAAGITLWMALTGVHPFIDQNTPPADFPGLIALGIPRLRQFAPHIPRQLATVVETACSIDPAVRYSSAAAMDEALGALPKFNRLWREVSPQPGEARRWVSTCKPTESHGFTVVVKPTGPAFDIETRKSGGAMNRSSAHCFRAIRPPQLPVRLRSVFSNLA